MRNGLTCICNNQQIFWDNLQLKEIGLISKKIIYNKIPEKLVNFISHFEKSKSGRTVLRLSLMDTRHFVEGKDKGRKKTWTLDSDNLWGF